MSVMIVLNTSVSYF